MILWRKVQYFLRYIVPVNCCFDLCQYGVWLLGYVGFCISINYDFLSDIDLTRHSHQVLLDEFLHEQLSHVEIHIWLGIIHEVEGWRKLILTSSLNEF